MHSQDFDWSDPKQVTIPRQDAISISEVDTGEVEIRQQMCAFASHRGDDVVLVSKENLPTLISALSAYLEKKS